MPQAVNLAAKLALLSEHWSPKIVAAFNGHDNMVVKLQGEYVWHAHADTDDFFLVLEGRMPIETQAGDVHLEKGDLYVVPKGVRHRPVADEEAQVLLIEIAGEPNTGDSTERQAAVKSKI